MLDCAWNPTRQPARSLPTAVVTTTIGPSRLPTIESNASSTEEECVTASLSPEGELHYRTVTSRARHPARQLAFRACRRTSSCSGYDVRYSTLDRRRAGR